MPHGSARVGNVEVVALCDGVVGSSSPIEESFPGGAPGTWDDVRARYPGTVSDAGHWLLHVHAFALRSAGRTILVDTGFGPATAPAFAWAGKAGRLPVELAEAGIQAPEVDTVLVTHVHDDHIGWTVFEGGQTLHFPNARHVVNRADWDWMEGSDDPEDVEIFTKLLKPLEDLGALELSDDRVVVTDELALVHAPGHTPGHQVVLIESEGERALLSGDAFNHPAQVPQPTLASSSDADPQLAVRTRTELLERAEREGRLVVPSHFPEPFGRVVTEDGRRAFRASGVGGGPGSAR